MSHATASLVRSCSPLRQRHRGFILGASSSCSLLRQRRQLFSSVGFSLPASSSASSALISVASYYRPPRQRRQRPHPIPPSRRLPSASAPSAMHSLTPCWMSPSGGGFCNVVSFCLFFFICLIFPYISDLLSAIFIHFISVFFSSSYIVIYRYHYYDHFHLINVLLY